MKNDPNEFKEVKDDDMTGFIGSLFGGAGAVNEDAAKGMAGMFGQGPMNFGQMPMNQMFMEQLGQMNQMNQLFTGQMNQMNRLFANQMSQMFGNRMNPNAFMGRMNGCMGGFPMMNGFMKEALPFMKQAEETKEEKEEEAGKEKKASAPSPVNGLDLGGLDVAKLINMEASPRALEKLQKALDTLFDWYENRQ